MEHVFKINSKRAIGFLDNPENLKVQNKAWEFQIEGSKFEVITYQKSNDLLESLFKEALSRILLKKDFSLLLNLSFKEIENYLRDENHLPVFGNLKTGQSLEAEFLKIKNVFTDEVVLERLKAHKMDTDDWYSIQKEEGKTLVLKNQKAQKLVFLLNTCFSKGKELDLVLFEDQQMTVILNDFPLDIGRIESITREAFYGLKENSNFLVVAVQ